MIFQKGYLYHIYNQGNNHQKIFLKRENYLFFLQKMKSYILPYGDFLAWCLMPNHFHFMVKVNEVELPLDNSQCFTLGDSQGFTLSEALAKRTLNASIGIMLRSYTRAINKQQASSGSLFRQKTKAECLNDPTEVTPAYFMKNGVTHINITNSERQYPQVCFDYIHQNPVKAKLAKLPTDWEFSSARDYAGMRDGSLVNKEVAGEYIVTR